jgi:hypothetical protein
VHIFQLNPDSKYAQISTLGGHSDEVQCVVAQSYEGFYPMLATGSLDLTIRIWNLHTMTSDRMIEGHSGEVCIVLCCAVLCYAMLCCAMLCYAMLYYAVLCYNILYYAILCYAMLCYAVLCYTMLYYAMLCCAMLLLFAIAILILLLYITIITRHYIK